MVLWTHVVLGSTAILLKLHYRSCFMDFNLVIEYTTASCYFCVTFLLGWRTVLGALYIFSSFLFFLFCFQALGSFETCMVTGNLQSEANGVN
jgi:hypothetical protein